MSWSIEWPPPITAPASATFSAPPPMISSSISRGEDLHRERHEREREDRPAAHRIDVGEGVRRGDPSEEPGVVHDGREEVDRLDDGLAAGDPVHRGVVRLGVADEQVRVGRRGKLREDGREVELRDLARAAGARRERREGTREAPGRSSRRDYRSPEGAPAAQARLRVAPSRRRRETGTRGRSRRPPKSRSPFPASPARSRARRPRGSRSPSRSAWPSTLTVLRTSSLTSSNWSRAFV